MKYLVLREDLGSRTTGYIFYNGENKGFTGMTEKQIKDTLSSGGRLYGLVLDANGEITVDRDGFKTNNFMVRSGISNLTPAYESDCPANMMYVVVAAKRTPDSETMYETISSRYARVDMPEGKIKMLLEFGAIQGGVYLDSKGKLAICEGVQTIDIPKAN